MLAKRYVHTALLLIAVSILMMYTPHSIETNAQDPQPTYDSKGIPMVRVPGGMLQTGYTRQQAIELCQELSPQWQCDGQHVAGAPIEPHEVEIRTFYIDQFEVTVAAYQECVDADVCDETVLRYQLPEPTDVPMENVDYWAAAIYCAWRGARLPTETEWEYAARGPDGLIFPWGNEFDGTRLYVCDVNRSSEEFTDWNECYQDTVPIGSFEEGVSWIGAYNMAGNVNEWTSTQVQIDGTPAYRSEYRIIKGSSGWPYQAAGWWRFVDSVDATIGFRCATSLDPTIHLDNR